MREALAWQLVTTLDAAFPPGMSEATYAHYLHEFLLLDDEEAAQAAVEGLVRRRWPRRIAVILEVYQSTKARASAELREAQDRERAERGLSRPQRAELPERVRKWMAKRGWEIDQILKDVDPRARHESNGGRNMNTPLSADTPPHELLEATGQVAPPVRIAPLIEALGCRWKWTSDFKWPRFDTSEQDTILVRSGRTTCSRSLCVPIAACSSAWTRGRCTRPRRGRGRQEGGRR